MTNTLAYFENPQFTDKKSFITFGPWSNICEQSLSLPARGPIWCSTLGKVNLLKFLSNLWMGPIS
jgi:hypothetical protein